VFEIRFSRAPKARTRRWNTASEPIKILESFYSSSDAYSGRVFIRNVHTGEIVHTRYICG